MTQLSSKKVKILYFIAFPPGCLQFSTFHFFFLPVFYFILFDFCNDIQISHQNMYGNDIRRKACLNWGGGQFVLDILYKHFPADFCKQPWDYFSSYLNGLHTSKLQCSISLLTVLAFEMHIPLFHFLLYH